MADIFVSYSRQDKALVAPLVASLEAEGWSVWWDPEISPGEEFDSLISRELERARSLVVVWTPHSVDSRWVRGEARDAADRGVLVPVRLQKRQAADRFSRGSHHRSRRLGRRSRRARHSAPCARRSRASSDPKQAAAAAEPAKEKRAEVSICVLPFANMSGDPEQEYFSDGITEDVITDLGKVSALSIVSRNMAFSFKGAKGGVGEIGRQTKAAYVLVGSVRKAGDARAHHGAARQRGHRGAGLGRALRPGPQATSSRCRTRSRRRSSSALKLTLLPEEKRALEQRATTNVKAYKFYLMARQFSVMGNERHQEIIVRLCKRAVELDPSYAAPWATMAIAQWDMHRRSATRTTTARQRRTKPSGWTRAGGRARGAGRGVAGAGTLRRRIDGLRGGAAARSGFLRGQPYRRHVQHGPAPLRRRHPLLRGRRERRSIPSLRPPALPCRCYEAKGDRAGSRAAAKRALARIEKVIALEPDHGRALGYGAGVLADPG